MPTRIIEGWKGPQVSSGPTFNLFKPELFLEASALLSAVGGTELLVKKRKSEREEKDRMKPSYLFICLSRVNPC